jgi:hypothetical protein
VGRLLQQLRHEDDPLIHQVAEHHDMQPDRYALRVPARYRAGAAWERWRAGRIDAIHPVMRDLPGRAAFVYEALSNEPSSAAELARMAAVSRTATATALVKLAELGLAEHQTRGWQRGPVSLNAQRPRLALTSATKNKQKGPPSSAATGGPSARPGQAGRVPPQIVLRTPARRRKRARDRGGCPR